MGLAGARRSTDAGDYNKNVVEREKQSCLDLVQLSMISVTVKNPGQLHNLGLLVRRIDDAVLALCHAKASESSVCKMSQLLGVGRAGGPTKAEDLQEDLP